MKRTITSIAIVLAVTFGGMQKIVAQANISPATKTKHTNQSYEQLKAAGMLSGYTNEQLRDLQHPLNPGKQFVSGGVSYAAPASPQSPSSQIITAGPDTTICSN